MLCQLSSSLVFLMSMNKFENGQMSTLVTLMVEGNIKMLLSEILNELVHKFDCTVPFIDPRFHIWHYHHYSLQILKQTKRLLTFNTV